MDSTDIRIQKKKEVTGKKSPFHSGKLGKPAWRYMFLRDGSGRICKIWGGYSPKVYDADIVCSNKDYLEGHFKGAAIVGDTHFFSARATVKNPEIIAPPPDNVSDNLLRERGITCTRDEVRRKSADIRHFRARVEGPFSRVKKMFKCIDGGPYHAWRESPAELDNLLTWAVGVHNRRREVRDAA